MMQINAGAFTPSIVMTATAAPQIEFMKAAGMPASTEARITFTAVEPRQRLVFTQRNDFVPGVAAYDAAVMVEFLVEGDRVRILVTLERLHDAPWTERAVMGWESQLTRFVRSAAHADA